MKTFYFNKLIASLFTNATENHVLFLLNQFMDLKNKGIIDENVFVYLTKLIPLVESDELKAKLIESIVEFEQYEYDHRHLIEYLELIKRNVTSIESIRSCIGAMTASGLNKNVMFEQIIHQLDEEMAIDILCRLSIDLQNKNPSHHAILEKINHAYRLRYRTFVVSTFYFITLSFIGDKNKHNKFLNVNYPTVEAAIRDWAWNSAESVKFIIENRIITFDESKALIELGIQLLQADTDPESLFEQIYIRFNNQRDPFIVMKDLPK
jgi:hypothetical protein